MRFIMKFLTFASVVFVLLNAVNGAVADADKPDPSAIRQAKQELNQLKHEYSEGNILQIDVYYMPDDHESVAAMPETQVQSYAKIHLSDKSVDSTPYIQQYFATLVDKTRVLPNTYKSSDYTWGCIFYNRDKKAVLSIFVEHNSDCCSVNGNRCRLKGGIFQFLRLHYHDKLSTFVEYWPESYNTNFMRWFQSQRKLQKHDLNLPQ